MRNSENAKKNIQEYTVVNHHGFVEAAASFVYKGLIISMSTMGYNGGSCLNKVCVFNDKDEFLHDHDSVEKAIDYINKQ